MSVNLLVGKQGNSLHQGGGTLGNKENLSGNWLKVLSLELDPMSSLLSDIADTL